MNIPERMTPHAVDLRPRLGYGSSGEVFDAWRHIEHCLAVDTTSYVTSETGDQVQSSGQVYVRDVDGPIPMHSEIRMWPGRADERVTKVVKVSRYEHPLITSFWQVWVQ